MLFSAKMSLTNFLPLLSSAFELWLFVRFELILECGLTSSFFAQVESQNACGKFVCCKGKKTNHFFTSASFFCTSSRGSHGVVLLLDQQNVSVVFTLRLVFRTNIATCIETHSESVTGFACCPSLVFFFGFALNVRNKRMAKNREEQQHALKYFNHLYILFMSYQELAANKNKRNKTSSSALICLLFYLFACFCKIHRYVKKNFIYNMNTDSYLFHRKKIYTYTDHRRTMMAVYILR